MVGETDQGLLVEASLGGAVVFLTEAYCAIQSVGASIWPVWREEGDVWGMVANVEMKSYVIGGV